MAMLKSEYRQSTKRNMPRRWFDKLPHTHCALDDALSIVVSQTGRVGLLPLVCPLGPGRRHAGIEAGILR